MTNNVHQETIMVVDDTPANLKLLQKMLQDNRYRVVAFPAGKPALDAAARNPPDLILLDINMPEMNGFEVCERLKADEKLREIPVIFISALSEITDKVRAFTTGGVDYVTKPFQIEEVQARVRTHLDLCASRSELKKQNEILQENLRLREVVDQISKHDLKGPMTAFLNIPEMLMSAKNLVPDQIELLQLLSKSARRLMDMVHRSLDLYKMERGTYTLTPVPVNVIKVIHEVFREFDGLGSKKNLSCVLLLGQKPLSEQEVFELPGEEYLFFSLLSNLIKNALEASPAGKAVVVSLSRSPHPVIAINNQGVIPEQVRSRFFEKYATSGKDRGTGLGVFSSRLMAKTMGGDLSFTTNETGGTTVIIDLPAVPPVTKQKITQGEKHENSCR